MNTVSATGHASEIDGADATVLIVDDQAPFRAVARTVVTLARGYTIAGEAVTGEEAVMAAAALEPALILMDINLPTLEVAGGDEATPRPAQLDRLRGELVPCRDGIVERRPLAQGLFPPVLAEHGLTEALRSAADHAALPVTEDLADVGRFDAQNEAAVYFCCLEALHNAAEHAGAERIWLRIARLDDTVHFEVADDGDGFDPRSVSGGSGLANMRDRIGAAGGTLDVVTEPGFGCRIVGSVPVVPPA